MSNLSAIKVSLDVHKDGMIIVWVGGYPYSASNPSALWRVLQDLHKEPSERLAALDQAEEDRKASLRRQDKLRLDHQAKIARLARERAESRAAASPWTSIEQLAKRIEAARAPAVKAKPQAVSLTLDMLGLGRARS